ncbi:hypothetical protein DRO66_11930, partial [Candidatus Bathyarchaeota archaeon]
MSNARGGVPVNDIDTTESLHTEGFNMFYIPAGLLECEDEMEVLIERVSNDSELDVTIIDRYECAPHRCPDYIARVAKLAMAGVPVWSYSDGTREMFGTALMMADYSKGLFLKLGKESLEKKNLKLLETRIKVLLDLHMLKGVQLA